MAKKKSIKAKGPEPTGTGFHQINFKVPKGIYEAAKQRQEMDLASLTSIRAHTTGGLVTRLLDLYGQGKIGVL